MNHFNFKHGHAGKRPSKTYYAWASMRQRCQNHKKKTWPYYGGRGIKVCERWAAFENFLIDMGVCPDGMSLGRIDNDGNYEPGNCRWENAAQQNKNRSNVRRIEAFGKTQSIADWSRESGIAEDSLRYRIDKLRWSAEEAICRPLIPNGDPSHFREGRN